MENNEASRRGFGRAGLTLLLGLVLGIGLGLYVGWVAWPTQYTNADPAFLQTAYRYDYALMTAQAYAVDGDLDAAQARLDSLGDNAQYDWYLATTLDAIIQGRPAAELGYLARLAQALGLTAPALAPYLGPAGAGAG